MILPHSEPACYLTGGGGHEMSYSSERANAIDVFSHLSALVYVNKKDFLLPSFTSDVREGQNVGFTRFQIAGEMSHEPRGGASRAPGQYSRYWDSKLDSPVSLQLLP